MEDNMMREESILILPYNTLRVMDVPLQMEIDKAAGRLFHEPFDDIVFKMVTRSVKDLSLYNRGVNKEILDELVKINYPTYYELAPRTMMYEIVTIMTNQKFIKKTTVLFPDKDTKDDVFEYDYYDGTIESLEDYINYNEITCIIFDDMELLKTLNDRKNISLNEKSFIVSRVGYNFYRDKIGELRLKYYADLLKENRNMELTIMDLYNFPESVIRKFNKKGKENKK